MRASAIAQRYARALLDLGIERRNFEQLGRELDRVANLFQSGDLAEVLRNPKFDAEIRKGVLGELLRRLMVSPVCRNFVFLLVDRNRVRYLPDIVTAYHGLADEHAGRLKAHVTVATRLSEPDAARLRTILQNMTGSQVVLEQEEDPEILGGIITRIGDRIYDGSVRAQLETLRGELKQAGL